MNTVPPSESAALASPSFVRDLEQVVARFERAWLDDARPRLEDYLPLGDEGRRELLLELVHADLEFRLDRHEAAEVGDYLQRFPELAQDGNSVLGLLVREYELRCREGTLTPEQFAGRYPDYAATLLTRLRAAASTSLETPSYAPHLRHDPHHCGRRRPRCVRPDAWPAIPGYEIHSVLGWGGMAIVYKAHQLRLNRHVALKMVRDDCGASAEDLLRFLGEAEAVAALQHDGIVQVYEVGQHNHLPYLTLEYCDRGSLADLLRAERLSCEQAAQMVEAIARAVEAAHVRGIVHRDLKPGNVLLTQHGGIKVTDFGLAKRLHCGPGMTLRGAVLGTPAYMPPEQARGDSDEVGPAADVYALGAMLYECLTGRVPFRASTSMDTLVEVMLNDPVPVRRHVPDTPRELETICLKALAKEPAHRYASAGALADDLARWRAGQPILGRSRGPQARAWRWCRSNRVATALAAALVLTLFTATGLVVLLGKRIADLQQELHQVKQPSS